MNIYFNKKKDCVSTLSPAVQDAIMLVVKIFSILFKGVAVLHGK